MGEIPAQFVDWSPSGILALVILLIITDKLVWHKRLEEERARTEKALQQGEAAAEVAKKSNEQVELLVSTVGDIATDMDLAVAMLRAVQRRLDVEEE